MCVLDSSQFVLDVLWMCTNLLKGCSRFLYYPVPLNCFCLIDETVTNAGYSEDQSRVLWVRFDFLAQLCHVDVQAVCPVMRLLSPDIFEELLPCENLATMGDEDLEQVILCGCQRDLSPVDLHPPPREINREWSRLKPWLGAARGLCCASQGNAHASQHLVHAEGFGDVVVCSQIERFDLIAFGVFDREHDNGYIRRCTYLPAYLQAAHTGQQEIEQQEIGTLPGQHL